MRYLILLIALSSNCNAGDIYAFGGLFAYEDNETKQDYNGLSPNAYYGIAYEYKVDSKLSVQIGVKHESSVGYREIGKGFNGVFFESKLKIF